MVGWPTGLVARINGKANVDTTIPVQKNTATSNDLLCPPPKLS